MENGRERERGDSALRVFSDSKLDRRTASGMGKSRERQTTIGIVVRCLVAGKTGRRHGTAMGSGVQSSVDHPRSTLSSRVRVCVCVCVCVRQRDTRV